MINELKKKNCDVIRFYSPSSIELFKYVQNICKKEKIRIEDNTAINELVNFSQFDIRRLLYLIQDYVYNYKVISNGNMEMFIKHGLKKNISLNLYESSLSLLNEKLENDNVYKLYKNEKVLLPLMIHENYYKKMMGSKTSALKKLDNMIDISESISLGDKIETSIYTDQNWFLQNIHCFHTCIKPSIICSKYGKQLTGSNIDFGADLNKTSLKNKNKKNILNLRNIIGNRTVDEILCLSRLSNHLFKLQDYKTLINIIKEYEQILDIKDIELFLKIDKTIDFLKLSIKEKKVIKELI